MFRKFGLLSISKITFGSANRRKLREMINDGRLAECSLNQVVFSHFCVIKFSEIKICWVLCNRYSSDGMAHSQFHNMKCVVTPRPSMPLIHLWLRIMEISQFLFILSQFLMLLTTRNGHLGWENLLYLTESVLVGILKFRNPSRAQSIRIILTQFLRVWMIIKYRYQGRKTIGTSIKILTL